MQTLRIAGIPARDHLPWLPFLALGALLACGDGPPPAQPEAGHLIALSDGQLGFIPCGHADTVALTDQTGGEASAMLQGMTLREGFTAVIAREAQQLLAVHYAGVEGPSCEELPPAGEVEVRGQEPFWAFTVADGAGTFRTPDRPDGVRYSGGGWETDSVGHLSYKAHQLPAEGNDSLRLDLDAGPCLDPMADARYAWRATLHTESEDLTGCALLGRQFNGPRAARP